MKKKIALFLNLLLIVLEIVGFIVAFKTGEEISPAYYTEDSNLICLIASIVYVFAYFRKKTNDKKINLFRFIATLNLIFTLLITLFILSRDYGLYNIMIKNEFIFFHTLCPIISFVSYMYFEKYRVTKTTYMMKYAPILSIIYGVIVVILNYAKVLNGPYSFLLVYENSILESVITFAGMFLFLYLLTYTLYQIKKNIKI